ncbi:hypothetical protein DL95DRAFT_378687, partial [Leptodontidium sp. 2 PMI_412]
MVVATNGKESEKEELESRGRRLVREITELPMRLVSKTASTINRRFAASGRFLLLAVYVIVCRIFASSGWCLSCCH